MHKQPIPDKTHCPEPITIPKHAVTQTIAAVGVVENGMKIKEVIRVINDIAKEKEIVGLTIAEHIPRVEIMIKNILDRLPLIN